jgi:murein DD-endopeptidase MepM/ murein hydrolase activator NlpD
MIEDVNMAARLGMSPGEKPGPKELAAKIQSMFTEIMIKTMEDSVEAEDGLFGKGANAEIYRGMLREELAKAMTVQVKDSVSRPTSVAPEVPRPEDLPVAGTVTSSMGWRQDPVDGEMRFHSGIDIAAPMGSSVRAVASGRVVESGAKGGYGNSVVVLTDDGRTMLYAHNQKNLVQVGDRVSRGDAIALVGSTGRSTGPHVHFEVSE